MSGYSPTIPCFSFLHFLKAKWPNRCADFLEFYLSLCFFFYTLGMMLTNFKLKWWFGLLWLNITVSVGFKTNMNKYVSILQCESLWWGFCPRFFLSGHLLSALSWETLQCCFFPWWGHKWHPGASLSWFHVKPINF